MRTILFVVALVPGPLLAQVSNYVGKNPSAFTCATTIVVAPTITPDIVSGVDQEESRLPRGATSVLRLSNSNCWLGG